MRRRHAHALERPQSRAYVDRPFFTCPSICCVDAYYSVKKRFCNAGNTSVVLSPVTFFSTGKRRGATSSHKYRFFTAVNAGKNSSQRFPHCGHHSRYPMIMVRCSRVERVRDEGGELLVLRLLTQTCARVEGGPSHPAGHGIINSYHILDAPPTLRRIFTAGALETTISA